MTTERRFGLVGRLVRIFDQGKLTGYGHWCPGCNHFHPYFRTEPYPTPMYGPIWQFDGDEMKPSFSPSMRVFGGGYERKMPDGTMRRVPEVTHCHYHLQKGRLNFCADSPHALRGAQGIVLPEIETDGEMVWLKGAKP
jgi:hypothetical protein